jgi:tRNA(Ile)-lysidine synthase
VLDRVRQTIDRHRMLEGCHALGVAVSGGADSVCLLHILLELAPAAEIALHVLHLNHGLRGAASAGDASFVEKLAADLGLPVHLDKTDLSAASENLEQAGRNARRAFFARLRSAGVVDRVATGHTRSDQAETVLYRLLRGSGTAGLAGILPVTAEGIIRPLIDCSRQEVELYLRERHLAWREDSTNGDPRFVRNRIRHRLLPALVQDYGEAVPDILAATAAIARDEEDFWAEQTVRHARKLFVSKDGAVLLRTPDLLALHPAAGRRLLRHAISQVSGDLRRIDIPHIERLLELAANPEGHGRMQAPGLDVFRSFQWLRIGRPRTNTRFDRDYAFEVPPAGGTFPIGETAICLEIDVLPETKHYTGRVDEVDAGRLGSPLELRNWHPGDEFQPVGRSRTKIKTLFQEARIPIWDRHEWPVLVSGTEIIWTREFGASESYVARTQNSGRILRVFELGPRGQSRESNEAV